MPPKRKAPLAATTGNNMMEVPAAKKVARGKGVGVATAAGVAAAAGAASKVYKYSDPAMIKDGGEEVKLVFFKWPVRRDDDEEEEEEEEEGDSEGESSGGGGKGEKDAAEKDKEIEKDFVVPKVVTDEGFPITRDGIQKFLDLNREVENRDQECQNMYVYNDFSGYGVTEVMENLLAEFNSIIYKKDISPAKKWALVEGLATYLEVGDFFQWMMSNDSEGMEEVLNMFGTMFITAYDMLHESSLLASDSPIPNVAVMSLFLLNFVTGTCSDFDLPWPMEIVRALDKYKVELKARKQIKVSQEELDELRESYKGTRAKGFNWKTEYARFKKNHPGGDEYDLSKWSAKEKAKFKFGTKENDAWMKNIMDSDGSLNSEEEEDDDDDDDSE